MSALFFNFEKKYAMIQPQEIRIGNYIDYNGEIMKLDGSLLCCYIQNELEFPINPIPLTEEILLKFRYKKIRDNEFLFDNHFIIFIKGSKIDFCLFNSEGNDFFVCEIQFAHELQNLHYSIRKEELKFEDIS